MNRFADGNAVARVLENFYKFNNELTLSQIMVFLYAAQKGVCYQKDIELAFNMTGGTASRLCSAWTNATVRGKSGYDFIEYYEDVSDRRFKLLRINQKGKDFYDYAMQVVGYHPLEVGEDFYEAEA